jgi:hypothetical protein
VIAGIVSLFIGAAIGFTFAALIMVGSDDDARAEAIRWKALAEIKSEEAHRAINDLQAERLRKEM